MSKMGKTLFSALVVVFLAACQEKQEVQDFRDGLDLSNMEFDFGSFGFDKPKLIPEGELRDFLSQASLEIDEAFKENKNLRAFTYSLTLDNGQLFVHDIKLIESSDDPGLGYDPSVEVVGRCPEGWDKVETCYSQGCIHDAVASEFEELEGDVDCMRVQVSVGSVNAAVCSQPC